MKCGVLFPSLLPLLLFGSCSRGPEEAGAKPRPTLRIAVASNFAATLSEIAEGFEEQTGASVVLSSGSSGKHYAQIRNGAPFTLFFAADTALPQQLDSEGAIIQGSRATYAIGSLALWSRDPSTVDAGGKILGEGGFRHLSIANPALAPYGKAAQETLQSLGLWDQLKSRLVHGENIGQAYQFVHSGNAELGFAAWSQLVQHDNLAEISWWRVPESLHAPVVQQLVLLEEHPLALAFLTYLQGEEARTIIQDSGYRLP